MKRRIAVISIAEYPGTALPEFSNLVHELQRASYQTVVVAGSQGPLRRDVDGNGNTVYHLPARSRLAKELFFLRAGWLLRHERIELVHLFWRFGAWLITWTRLLPRKKIIMDVRSGSIAPTPWRRWIENSILRFEKHFFSTKITIDAGLNGQLQLNAATFFPLGVPQSYVSAAAHQHPIRTLRPKLGLSDDALIGIFVGTSFGRRLETLLRAWSVFSQKNTSRRHHLVIVGDAYHNSQLHQQAQDLPCSFLPPVRQEDLIPYLREADYGISFVPITPWFTWQQSTKILDYSAFHLPILATATQSNQQFIEDGVNGVLTADTDSAVTAGLFRLTELLPQTEFQSANKIRATQLVTTYSWEHLVRQNLIPLYEQLA